MRAKQHHGTAHKLDRASLLEVKCFHGSVRCGCYRNGAVLRKISNTVQGPAQVHLKLYWALGLMAHGKASDQVHQSGFSNWS